jgi:hypothetical protein
MHSFPPSEKLGFLVGLEVGQICLDPWSTQVIFSDGGQITIEGPFEHADAQQVIHVHQAGDYQDRGPVFFRDLIQQVIVAVERADWLLTLVFANGAMLRISAENSQYENGQIHRPGDEQNPIVF